MDAEDVDPAELRRALAFIRRINTFLGYNASVARRVVATLPSRTASVLDVATGSGDLLVSLAGRVPTLNLIGLDRHATTLGEAQRVTGSTLIRGDALALPFDDASVDVVISTMFLHHLPDEVAVAALAEMRRVARHAVVVADLLRDARAYRWISLFTAFSSPMIRHDARASVAHAFTIAEFAEVARRAGMDDAKIERTFGHRFALTWVRGEPATSSQRA